MILRFVQVRKALKMSQAEFGKRLGVSRDVIGNIEYGRVKPKEIFIDHMCTVLGINKDWLTAGNGDMFVPELSESKELREAIELFSNLSPPLQEYALKQIRGLLVVQNQQPLPNQEDKR